LCYLFPTATPLHLALPAPPMSRAAEKRNTCANSIAAE